MQEKEILQTEITECQEKIKGIKDNIEKCKLQEQDIEMEINDKIEDTLSFFILLSSFNEDFFLLSKFILLIFLDQFFIELV